MRPFAPCFASIEDGQPVYLLTHSNCRSGECKMQPSFLREAPYETNVGVEKSASVPVSPGIGSETLQLGGMTLRLSFISRAHTLAQTS